MKSIALIILWFIISQYCPIQILGLDHNCPAKCTCNVATAVLCTDEMMTNFPIGDEIMDNVTILQVTGTNIRRIRNHDLNNYSSLVQLDLRNNKIEVIEGGAFTGLLELKSLMLDSNLLQTLTSISTFEDLENLQTLSITRNRLYLIADGVFLPLSNLTTLSLDTNEISNLQDIGFRGLSKLTYLAITDNRIHEVQEGVFRNMPLLKRLYLNTNLIAKVSQKSWDGIEDLYLLSLAANTIKNLTNSVFSKFVNMEVLSVSLNDFLDLENYMFSELSSIKRLSLYGNELTIVRSHLLYGMWNLELLRLFSNKIEIIEPRAFANLTKLSYINLSWNRLVSVSSIMFGNLPSLNRLIITDNYVSTISSTAFVGSSKLQTLELSGNGISQISNTTFSYLTHLSKLDMRVCSINDIEANLFSNNAMLKTLDMSGCKIQSLSENAFANLTSLKILDLSSTLLNSIPPKVFGKANGTVLEKLNLHNSFITSVDEEAFNPLTNLKILTLHINSIQSLEPNTFANLLALEELNLSQNKLTFLEGYRFSSLDSLKKLYIASNEIQILDINAFAGLNTLQELNIINNYLVRLNLTVFSELYNLKILLMDENQIRSIEDYQFTDLANLKSLFLRSNNIQTISSKAFHGLNNIEEIWLDGNPFHYITELPLNNFISLHYLGLSKNKMRLIDPSCPSNISYNISRMDLSNNLINGFKVSGCFQCLQLINISSNRLSSDKSLSLDGIPCLSVIDISENRIRNLASGIFTTLKDANSMTILNISSNQLRYIKSDSFAPLLHLKELNIHKNELNTLDFIIPLHYLTNLFASWNRLSELKRNYFGNLTKLVHVDISHNKIKAIRDGIFIKCKELRNLYLNHNQISIIENQAFLGLSKLLLLDISYNKLVSLNGFLIQDISQLSTLYCNGNKIVSLAGAPFFNLTLVTKLSLDNNLIAEMADDSFTNLISLRTLSMNQNRLTNLSCSSIYKTVRDLRLSNNNISGISNNCDRTLNGLTQRLDLSSNNLVQNGIDLYQDILIKLLGLPFELLLAGNNIESIPQVYFKWNIYLRSFSIGRNNMSIANIKQSIRGFYITTLCFSPIYATLIKCFDYSIDLSYSNLKKIPPGIFVHLNGFLKILKLNKNKLVTVNASEIFRDTDNNLQELHLADNQLNEFKNPNNIQFNGLKILNVARNKLSEVCGKSHVLGIGPNLLEIYLDQNGIRYLDIRCFGLLFKLQLLSIKSNPLVYIRDNSFYGSTSLNTVISTRDYLCCIVPAKVTTCAPVPDLDSVTSCENILAHMSLKLSVWIMGIAAFVGNIFVVTSNHSNRQNKLGKVTILLIDNLAVADFLMSIYLFIIAIGDQVYIDRYANYSEEWLTSPACIIASFLICTSGLMSVIMMLLISIDRYIVTAYPFSSKSVRVKRCKVTLISAWSLTCLFVGIPVTMSINQPGDLRLYQFSSVCTPSNLSNGFFASWTIFFVVIQFIFWIITLILYIKLMLKVRKSSRSIRSSAQSHDFAIAVRLSLILITDLLAWLPVYIISVLALTQGSLSVFILQFAVILALPLNSAINPYIYTATGTACFHRLFHLIDIRKSSFSRSFRVPMRHARVFADGPPACLQRRSSAPPSLQAASSSGDEKSNHFIHQNGDSQEVAMGRYLGRKDNINGHNGLYPRCNQQLEPIVGYINPNFSKTSPSVLEITNLARSESILLRRHHTI